MTIPSIVTSAEGGATGKYSDGTVRSVDFRDFEGFEIMTGSGNDALLVGGFGWVSSGGGNDSIWLIGNELSADGGAGDGDGLSVDLSSVTYAIEWRIPANKYLEPGFAQRFENFEYLFDVKTGSGADVIETGHGAFRDHIRSGAGNDQIIFYNGYGDTAYGGDGDDLLIVDWRAHAGSFVQVTAPSLPGGLWSISGGARSVEFDGIERLQLLTGAGADRIQGSAFSELFDAGGGDDRIDGFGGNDELNGGSGNDIISGGDGDDLLNGGDGIDMMAGGLGNDIYIVDNAGDVVTENAGEGDADEIRTSIANYALPANVERLVYTGSGQSSLRGNAASNTLNGSTATDIFNLADGGDDSASGGAGDDLFYYGAAFTAADANNGGAGTQDVVVLQGDYVTTLGAASLVDVEYLVLYSGSVTRFGDTAGNRYDYDITTVDANVGPGQQLRVNGSLLLADESFTFDGSAETDGYFLVYGGYGADRLTGGAGGDGFYFEGTRFGSGDKVDGGAGSDVVILRGIAGMNTVVFGADQLSNIETISVSDRFASTPSQLPSYHLTVVNGNVPASGTLTVNGFALVDSRQTFNVDGSAITAGNLRLFGGAGDDRLIGGAGNDLIYAVGGGDILIGGGGADTFQLRALSNSAVANMDEILDFTAGSDRIDLSFLDANSTAGGNQAFAFVGSAAFSRTAGELRAFDTGLGYWLVEGDVDGDGAADFALNVTPATSNPLVSSDFIL